MPSPCCVPNCNGNYRNGPVVSVYRFPKDPEQLRIWLRNIHREDFQPTKHSRVCELHFKETDIEKEMSSFDEKTGKVLTVPLKNPRLKCGAVPTLMPNCPSYLSSSVASREDPDCRRLRIEQEALSKAFEASVQEKAKYDSDREFSNLEELSSKTHLLQNTDFWTVINKEKKIIFAHLQIDLSPVILSSVVINEDLKIDVFVGKNMLKSLFCTGKLPMKVNNINTLSIILEEVQSLTKRDERDGVLKDTSRVITILQNLLDSIQDCTDHSENMVSFIKDQLTLINCNKHHIKYPPQTMVFASLLYTMAPSAYRFIRNTGYILLPHPTTIRKVCSSVTTSPQAEQLDGNFLSYVKMKYDLLSSSDKTTVLMMDEIHIKPFYDYKGGNIVGAAFNTEVAASSAYVFMIGSILSPFTEVVHILPVKTIAADILHTFLKKVIIGLEEIGFTVISVISDNNSINKKCMSFFSTPPKVSIVYPHPTDNSRPLFFVIDPVHLLKCIRNNWINQKNDGKCMFFPKFGSEYDTNPENVCTAAFSSLRRLYDVEKDSLLKFGYNLTLKSLSPSSIEKQNVKLVLKIFNEFVPEGLLQLGEKHEIPNYKDTAEYIKLINKWWNIVNVKTPFTGTRLNHPFKTPLTMSEDDEKYKFLGDFLNWLDAWENMKFSSGTLTRETHSALKLTTHALVELVSYCTTELQMKYILPGKFQTDNLEARFGMYRQLAGAQYHVSIRQVFECENKLRIQSMMKLQLTSNKFGDVSVMREDVPDNWATFKDLDFKVVFPFHIEVADEDIDKVSESMKVITYLAGYCVHAVVKRNKCNFCKNYLTMDKEIEVDDTYSLIKNLDRGKLQYPHESAVNAVLYNYIVTQKLCADHEIEFLKSPNQKYLCTAVTLQVLEKAELLGNFDICEAGHSSEEVFKMLLWSSVNTLLNNYCKKVNDTLSQPSTKKRKLQTLMKPTSNDTISQQPATKKRKHQI